MPIGSFYVYALLTREMSHQGPSILAREVAHGHMRIWQKMVRRRRIVVFVKSKQQGLMSLYDSWYLICQRWKRYGSKPSLLQHMEPWKRVGFS